MTVPFDADDDRALMLRACAGEREAFAILVARHQQPLLNFFRRAGVYTDAEDMVQQTFIRLYRYRDRYRPSAKLTTFLYLLARQVMIDEARRRRRRERFQESWQEETEQVAAPDTGPKAGRLDLDMALATLPEALRLVVVMGIYQQMPYADIATVLRIPVGTVKSRMFNALRQLRRVLEES